MKCSCGKEFKSVKEFKDHLSIQSMFRHSFLTHVIDEPKLAINDNKINKLIKHKNK